MQGSKFNKSHRLTVQGSKFNKSHRLAVIVSWFARMRAVVAADQQSDLLSRNLQKATGDPPVVLEHVLYIYTYIIVLYL